MDKRCIITGKVVSGSSDAIWDDGDWISWEGIAQLRYELDLKEKYPGVSIELIKIFEDLVDIAIDYKNITGRYLPVFGELGELFAEITFGIKRHKPGSPGSDGRLGNDFVEIKTITPEKKKAKVTVKRKGNFNKLIVVKIDANFEFEARMLDRKKISKGSEGVATVSWASMKSKQLKK